MFKIFIRYGIQTEEMESNNPITVGAVKQSITLRAKLGYGDNVNALIEGVAMPDEAIVPTGETLVLETACNTKAND
jgi:hypothetical protein